MKAQPQQASLFSEPQEMTRDVPRMTQDAPIHMSRSIPPETLRMAESSSSTQPPPLDLTAVLGEYFGGGR